jgi:hypothetical protein
VRKWDHRRQLPTAAFQVSSVGGSTPRAARTTVPIVRGADDRLRVTAAPSRGARLPSLQRGASLLVLGVAVVAAGWQVGIAATHDWFGHGAADYQLYVDVTRRWISGGAFYQPWQLAGPYSLADPYGAILYPPVALWLFAPFTVLPAALWWILPIAAVTWVIWRHRPDPRVWPLLGLCLAWPPTVVKVITGNPVIWVMACVALGTIYAWPAVFVLIKPSLFPFALIDMRKRSWWFCLVIFALACLPFGGMWASWLETVLNARDGGVLYSVQEIPLLLFPVIAALGSRHGRTERRKADERHHGGVASKNRGIAAPAAVDPIGGRVD